MKKTFAPVYFALFGILVVTMPTYGATRVSSKNKPTSINAKIDNLSVQHLQLLRGQERQQQHLQEISMSLKKLTEPESVYGNTYSYP